MHSQFFASTSCILASVLVLSSLMAADAFTAGGIGFTPALCGSKSSICSSKAGSFVGGVSQPALDASSTMQRESRAKITGLRMGKQAAFGPFTPAVIAVRSVVGEKKFNQIRGKVRVTCSPLPCVSLPHILPTTRRS
jgi:hypothetical protein